MKLLISFLVVCCVAALVNSAPLEPQLESAESTDVESADAARDKRGVTVSVDTPATVSVASPGAAVVPAAYPYYSYPYAYPYSYYPYYPYGAYNVVVAGK